MKTTTLLFLTLAWMLALGTGCDPGEQADGDDPIEFRTTAGVWLNTSSLGLATLSGIDLTGEVLDGTTLTSVLLQRPGDVWLAVDQLEIASGHLQGRVGETYYTGTDLVGSRWQLSPAEGEPYEIWISGYSEISATEARYTFQALDAHGDTVHVCAPDASGQHAGYPLADILVDHATGAMTARPNTLYIACISGAIGKAVTWGYSPVSLALDEFTTVVRMIRADYCFDGASWTTAGTGVQIKDKWNIDAFLYSSYMTEAVWTATGVACLSHPRWSEVLVGEVTCNGQPLPTCPGNVSMTTYPQTLLWTKRGSPGI